MAQLRLGHHSIISGQLSTNLEVEHGWGGGVVLSLKMSAVGELLAELALLSVPKLYFSLPWVLTFILS